MKFDPLVYAPLLHPELAPGPLPRSVLFMRPGLPEEADSAAGLRFTPDNFPFKPAVARAILRETIELGKTLSTGGGLKLLAGTKNPAPTVASPEEEKQLLAFAADGALPSSRSDYGAGQPGGSLSEQLENSQKVLLLAWELEENLLQIRFAEKNWPKKTCCCAGIWKATWRRPSAPASSRNFWKPG